MQPVLLFFDISGGELLMILLAVFLLFGPSKFPEISRKLGKSINSLKETTNEIKEEMTKTGKSIEEEINKEIEDYKKNHELKG